MPINLKIGAKMAENRGRLTLEKAQMVHLIYNIFQKDVKDDTTREELVSMVPELLLTLSIEELLELFPYDVYKALEIIKKNGKKAEKNPKLSDSVFEFLHDAMILVVRATSKNRYSEITPGIIEAIEKMFSKENEYKSKKYELVFRAYLGLVNRYGVATQKVLRKQMAKFFPDMTIKKIKSIIDKRMVIKMRVYHFFELDEKGKKFKVMTSLPKKPYLKLAQSVLKEQASRNYRYKEYTRKEVLKKKNLNEAEATKEFKNYLENNTKIVIKYFDEEFYKLLIKNELGFEVHKKIMSFIELESEEQIDNIIMEYIKWYNNTTKFILGSYSPKEYKEKFGEKDSKYLNEMNKFKNDLKYDYRKSH